jgi:hypothetical protein
MGNQDVKSVPLKKLSPTELQTYVMIVQARLTQSRNKKVELIRKKRQEIAKCLQENTLDIAKAKMESLLREEDFITVFDILGPLCEIVKEKVSYLLLSDKCPDDMRATLDTILYASTRLEIDELHKIREAMYGKYGELYATKATTNADSLVNVNVVEKLKIKPVADQYLIARLKQLVRDDKINYEFPEEVQPIVPNTQFSDFSNFNNQFSNMNQNIPYQEFQGGQGNFNPYMQQGGFDYKPTPYTYNAPMENLQYPYGQGGGQPQFQGGFGQGGEIKQSQQPQFQGNYPQGDFKQSQQQFYGQNQPQFQNYGGDFKQGQQQFYGQQYQGDFKQSQPPQQQINQYSQLQNDMNKSHQQFINSQSQMNKQPYVSDINQPVSSGPLISGSQFPKTESNVNYGSQFNNQPNYSGFHNISGITPNVISSSKGEVSSSQFPSKSVIVSNQPNYQNNSGINNNDISNFNNQFSQNKNSNLSKIDEIGGSYVDSPKNQKLDDSKSFLQNKEEFKNIQGHSINTVQSQQLGFNQNQSNLQNNSFNPYQNDFNMSNNLQQSEKKSTMSNKLYTNENNATPKGDDLDLPNINKQSNLNNQNLPEVRDTKYFDKGQGTGPNNSNPKNIDEQYFTGINKSTVNNKPQSSLDEDTFPRPYNSTMDGFPKPKDN